LPAEATIQALETRS